MNGLRVTFSEKAIFSERESLQLLLELDEEKNNGATVFSLGGKAYIRLFPAGERPKLLCNVGSVSFDAFKLPLEVTEDVVLINTTTVSTKYPVFEIEDFEWLGKHWGGRTIQVRDRRLVVTEKATGVLRVRYKTYYDRLVATYQEEGIQLVIVQKELKATYISINWKETKKDVVITVKDACTRAVVEGAKVYVDGKFVGLTDSKGQVKLGKIKAGKHSIRVVKEGYQPTDQDNIKNDYFVISND